MIFCGNVEQGTGRPVTEERWPFPSDPVSWLIKQTFGGLDQTTSVAGSLLTPELTQQGRVPRGGVGGRRAARRSDSHESGGGGRVSAGEKIPH